MAKITRIEDITNIVGVKNYISALSMDMNLLRFIKFERKHKGIQFTFTYNNEQQIALDIDNHKNIYNLSCTCSSSLDYCSHIALAVMYLLKHEELLEEAFLVLGTDEESFNQTLYTSLAKKKKYREKIELEIFLKEIGYEKYSYELQIKIGSKKKYVLTKKLDEFLEVYQDGNGIVEFGKDFTYNPEEQYFDKDDESIIEFLELYIDSQNTMYRNYYGYYTPRTILNNIKLSGKSLTTFLELLKDKPFTYVAEYYSYHYDGICDSYPFNFEFEKLNNNLKVTYECGKIYPITKDYAYIRTLSNVYNCKSPELVQILLEKPNKQLLFKETEMDSFAQIVYPSIKKLEPNLKISKEIEEIVKFDTPSVRYYFDEQKNNIICTIKLVYKNEEQNILDENKFPIVRDYLKEQEYIKKILDYGFIEDAEKKIFYLADETNIICFMEQGIKELTKDSDVYISKKLKTFNVLKSINIESTFKIGRDNILSFEFTMDGVDQKEISSMLDSVRQKKKYYHLKNGTWIDLENNDTLIEFSNMIDTLDISSSILSKDNITISPYKVLGLENIEEKYDFVALDNEIHNVLDKFKKYKDFEVKFNTSDKKLLRDYQQIGIKWLLTLADLGFGGILADEMGLGKSLQTIKYIEMRKKLNKDATFLIVVPTSLIYNWQNEFKKYHSSVNVITVIDTKEKRTAILNDLGSYDVYITSYGLLRQDIEMYEKYDFDTCIIDEAQNIKNINTETTRSIKRINSVNRFALTGTPIENSVLELYSIFDFIMPGFFSNITAFKHKYNSKRIEEDPSILESLNKKVSPFILRRKKQDVLKELPEKIENNIYVELNPEQKKLYVAYLEKTKEEIDEVLKTEGFMKSQVLILSLLTKLRQICIDPKLIIEDYKEESAKMELVTDIIKQNIKNGHKMLLFSQFPSALRIVKEKLEHEHIPIFYLDGSTKSKERMRLVDEFNQNSIPVFLISLKAGGTGLNLTSADIVIHLDPWWNPQVENQATDRSHRIGQKNVVEVVKLITKGTIEEKIVALQEKKKMLSDKVIEGENRDQIILSKLTEEELKNLLLEDV